ncbi:nSTAND1 domain-containing NTPase [Calothrix sp. 336/3]|uniref:WD40 domain-containing protein n=1 Tax=Calothrix sp. 336/3 TaxID=1337936 RepID=UPI0004E3A678|nr:hypothetical protein [Calothrix sp. 336/3]AKG22609.1 WD40 repeat-containing protein [Calothrix sp. 336/3]
MATEHQQPSTDLTAVNERALTSLRRAIALSQGQFSLVLVRCNYANLQERMLQRLREEFLAGYLIQDISLPVNVMSLYSTIHRQISPNVAGLMVLGLEKVEALENLLTTINHLRDEFRKRHSFPMVFWVNDEVLRQLRRLAPDFTNWAATPIKLEMTTEELLQFLRQETNSLFTKILHPSTQQHTGTPVIQTQQTMGLIWDCSSHEFGCAIKDLENRGIKLEPELNACVEFVFGLDKYTHDYIDEAEAHFQKSLEFWQKSPLETTVDNSWNRGRVLEWETSVPSASTPPSPHILRKGVLLYCIGLCHYRRAERYQVDNSDYWDAAKSYFQESLQVFESVGYTALVAQFINRLAEVLQHLQAWDELKQIAEKSLELHQNHGTRIQLACDYGFLGEVAVQKGWWSLAIQNAHTALFYLAEAKNDPHQGLFPLLLEQIYRLNLAKALRQIREQKIASDQLDIASEQLQTALEKSDHRYDAHKYIRLLRTLRSLYFQSGLYAQAFRIRQQRRSVEQQYGFRAFIGAGRLQPQRQVTNPVLISPVVSSSIALEIAASGRERDINQLIGRISRPDQKLTVIHGQSGVGKSSTVTAGLVPALQNRAIIDQIAVPVVVQVYTDCWLRALGKSLAEAMVAMRGEESTTQTRDANSEKPVPILTTEAEIFAQLQSNADNYLITVLVFDQLEEFFFGCEERYEKERLDKFLYDCLQIPFVKVIFSVREDYLHHLLDFKHLSALEAINYNILDKNILYQLNNFTPNDAKHIIQKLTARSQLNLEAELIDVLVEDLAGDFQEVRPIELQVVGAQLQDERITTLAKYEPFRPNKLIERYLRELIQDCGAENERAALLVLYLLTDDNRKRPFKTKAELTVELAELEDEGKLELILDILVRSGLVILFPELPERYQLIHDYLVDLIRALQQEELKLQNQLKELRQQVQQRETEIARLNSELRKNKQKSRQIDVSVQPGLDLLTELKELRKREELSRLEIEQLTSELQQERLQTELAESREKESRSLKIALAGSVTAIFALTASTVMAGYLWRQAVFSEIRAIIAVSELFFAKDSNSDALREGIKAGRKLQTAIFPDDETKAQVVTALYQAIPKIREKQRLESHKKGVNAVSFSPDGKFFASASADKTIKLWHVGTSQSLVFQTLRGNTEAVNSVSFSPDGQLIASGGQDKTVRLWNLQSKLSRKVTKPILEGHKDVVNTISFSPDGQLLASASTDKTIIIWNRQGERLETLTGHSDAVLNLAWSPQGDILASASGDKTFKLWYRNGKLWQTSAKHSEGIKSLAWSPDGNFIVTGCLDGTMRLWTRKGKLVKSYPKQNDTILSLAFSPDGKVIASANRNKTIKLWRRDGVLIGTLKGHGDRVNSVIFSPDGKTLASAAASQDPTIRLWNWQDTLQQNLKAHSKSVTSISFAPKGDIFASASEDKSVKIWNLEGKLQHELLGHTAQVSDINFSPDGSQLASASNDKSVKIWAIDGKNTINLLGHTQDVVTVTWSPNGKIIASGSKDKTVKLWNPQGKELKTLTGHEKPVNLVRFSPDGQLVASASEDGTIKLWERDGKLSRTLSEGNPVNSIAWSLDSKTLVAVTDQKASLWSRDGILLHHFKTNGDSFFSVSFSPDGKIVAATSSDKARFWQSDGTLVINLRVQKDKFNRLTSLSFSPNQQTLAMGSANGIILLSKFQIEDIQLEKLLVSGCNSLRDFLGSNVTQSQSLCAE